MATLLCHMVHTHQRVSVRKEKYARTYLCHTTYVCIVHICMLHTLWKELGLVVLVERLCSCIMVWHGAHMWGNSESQCKKRKRRKNIPVVLPCVLGPPLRRGCVAGVLAAMFACVVVVVEVWWL